jgi:FlaA1/EpsC-like NDP-sugar epimerase
MFRLLGLPVSKWSLLLVLGDVVVFGLSVPLGYAFSHRTLESPWIFIDIFKATIGLMALSYILVLYVANLYDNYQDFRRREHLSQVILSSLIGTLVAIVIFSFPSRYLISRGFIEWQGVAFVWLLVFWRYTFSTIALPLRLQRRVLIIGAGGAGQEIAGEINRHKNSGLVAVGFLDDQPQKFGATLSGVPVLGATEQIDSTIQEEKINLVVIAITHEKPLMLLSNLVRLSFLGVEIIDMPSLYEFLASKIPTEHISDTWLLLQTLNKSKVYYRHFKRLTDLVLAGVGMLLTWPL